MTVGIEPWLRDILRCPRCRAELRDEVGPCGAPELVCTAGSCALAYRVDDGIPVLLVDEARRPDAGQAHAGQPHAGQPHAGQPDPAQG